MFKPTGLAIALLFGALSLEAGGVPASSCTFVNGGNPALGFNCSLYGASNAAIVTTAFPTGWDTNVDTITGGYIVIENPSANPALNHIVADTNNYYGASDANLANWTQILYFSPVTPTDPVGGDPANQVILYTVGCNNALNPLDNSCFPSYSQMMSQAYFDVYTSPDVYTLDENPGTNPDHIYTVTLVTPEPATVTFALGGIALLAGMRKLRGARHS